MNGEQIRHALRSSQRVFGTHITDFGGPQTAFGNAQLPLDFIFIDTEHAPLGRTEASLMCRHYAANGLSPAVRIPIPEDSLAIMALDGGAQGIVAPYVETVDQVTKVAGAVQYRPLKGAYLHDVLDGRRALKPETADYLRNYNRNAYLMIGIESVPAVENLDNLLSVQGVDGVFIGPHDLSVSMEMPEQYDTPEFQQMVLRIMRTTQAKGVGVGMHVKRYSLTRETMQQYFEAGLNWVLISHDTHLFAERIREDLEWLRGI